MSGGVSAMLSQPSPVVRSPVVAFGSIRRGGASISSRLAFVATLILSTPLGCYHERAAVRPMPLVEGPLLVLGTAPSGRSATLYAVASGRAPLALVAGLPAGSAVAPSPHGRYIALAEGARGLWLVDADGMRPRRLLAAPRSSAPRTYALSIRGVAWSPDRYTLAYSVGQDYVGPPPKAPFVSPTLPPDSRVGLWVVRYDAPRPRHVSRLARCGSLHCDAVIDLSWSSDGRVVGAAIYAGRGIAPYRIDVATGRSHLLLPSETGDVPSYVVYSPASPQIAYLSLVAPVYNDKRTPDPGSPPEQDALLAVADVWGGHARVVVRTPHMLASPAWSPDGRSIAYLWQRVAFTQSGDDGLEIRAVDVATGRVRVLLRGPLPAAFASEDVVSLAWMHAQS